MPKALPGLDGVHEQGRTLGWRGKTNRSAEKAQLDIVYYKQSPSLNRQIRFEMYREAEKKTVLLDA